jgi:hypothetical protein
VTVPSQSRSTGGPMKGLMQDEPLTLVHFFNRAERLFR